MTILKKPTRKIAIIEKLNHEGKRLNFCVTFGSQFSRCPKIPLLKKQTEFKTTSNALCHSVIPTLEKC